MIRYGFVKRFFIGFFLLVTIDLVDLAKELYSIPSCNGTEFS